MIVEIERLSNSADAIAHTPEGKTLFVSGAVPGDVCEVEIVQEKETFARAQVTHVVTPSQNRVTPACSPVEAASGCPWAHIAYDFQLASKEQNVRDLFSRIGKFDADEIEAFMKPALPSKEQWGYRNKIELNTEFNQASGQLEIGVAAAGSNKLMRLDETAFLPDKYRKLPKSVSGALKFALGKQDLGVERVGIRVSKRTKDLEVALWTTPGSFPRGNVAKIVKDATRATSVVRILMKGTAKSRKVSNVEVLSGAGSWSELVCGNTMRFSAPSFFQVNTSGAETLVQTVLEWLDPQEDDCVFDLYSGAGTFTVPLAQTGAEVFAVESYGPAVRDLRRNLEANRVYAEVIGGDTARELPELGEADLIVVDPPRAGLDASVIDALCASGARKIAYVSCDPSTLARDLRRFADAGVYRIEAVQPVDLFPQTPHVETVVLLSNQGRRH